MARNYIDTFDKKYWNLMQALMWMIFRAREWVNEAAKENEIYRTYYQELILPSGEKRLVEEQADPCNSLHILLHINSEISQGNTPYYDSFNEAWVGFTQKCQEGKIEVIALKNNQGEYVQIPSIEFIRLKPFTDNSGRTYLEADRGLGFSTRWYGAMIESNVVLSLWPPILEQGKDSAPKKPAYLRVKECYEEHGKRIIDDLKEATGRLPTKDKIASKMKETYLPDINLGTIKRHTRPSRDIAARKRTK